MSILIAQVPPPEPGAQPALFSIDNVFWFTIGLIFLVSIVGAFITRLSKDRCLKLLRGYHVTLLSTARGAIWGDLEVTSQGIELRFDSPYTTLRGITKSSALLYEDDYPTVVGLFRTVHGLTPRELRLREQQIRRTFNPSVIRRTYRAVRNGLNTVRDAIGKSFSLLVGRFTGRGAAGAAIKAQAGDITQLGTTAVGVVANAYEPLLERHIGRPVAVEVTVPTADGKSRTLEFPGYLVDYTARFIAVFNIEHTPIEAFEVPLSESSEDPVRGVKTSVTPTQAVVSCTGDDALIVRSAQLGDRRADYAVVLLPGMSVTLRRLGPAGDVLRLERTRQLDIVCPRGRARVRFGSGTRRPRVRLGWLGVSPEADTCEFDAPIAANDQ